MITRLSDIPKDRIMSCKWIIITHRLGDYLFENEDCFKGRKRISKIKSGGSIGYKINGRFRSLTWIKAHRKPHFDVMCEDVEFLPFLKKMKNNLHILVINIFFA